MGKKVPVPGMLYTPKKGWYFEAPAGLGSIWGLYFDDFLDRNRKWNSSDHRRIFSGTPVMCVSVPQADHRAHFLIDGVPVSISLERFQNGMKLVSESSD